MDTEALKIEFIELVKELLKVPSEDREKVICERLDKISPDPNYSDYIFYSDEFSAKDDSFNFEGLTEKVFNYKPILL